MNYFKIEENDFKGIDIYSVLTDLILKNNYKEIIYGKGGIGKTEMVLSILENKIDLLNNEYYHGNIPMNVLYYRYVYEIGDKELPEENVYIKHDGKKVFNIKHKLISHNENRWGDFEEYDLVIVDNLLERVMDDEEEALDNYGYKNSKVPKEFKMFSKIEYRFYKYLKAIENMNSNILVISKPLNTITYLEDQEHLGKYTDDQISYMVDKINKEEI
jgi:hypothetical protein